MTRKCFVIIGILFILIFFLNYFLTVNKVEAQDRLCDEICHKDRCTCLDPYGNCCVICPCCWCLICTTYCGDLPNCYLEFCYWCWNCGGECFTGETEISIGQEGERAGEQERETKPIKDLKPGDVVESFSPETGDIKEGTVSDVTKTTREGYYELETESGERVKVTGEHPFLALKSENNQIPNSKSQTISKFQNSISKLEEILSQTLTYKVITGLQAKISNFVH